MDDDAKKRAKMLEEVFGDPLFPETTTDEVDPPESDRSRDDWYRENRPPHHDRSD